MAHKEKGKEGRLQVGMLLPAHVKKEKRRVSEHMRQVQVKPSFLLILLLSILPVPSSSSPLHHSSENG